LTLKQGVDKFAIMGKQIKHRQDNDLTHSMVHYLLTIHKLRENLGYARVTDIAKDLELTKGSVSTALNNLKKRDLVVEDVNKFLSLSEEGHNIVHDILSSRTLLFYFFKDFLKVNEKIAHTDSCLMEHLLSDESRDKLFAFMKEIGPKISPDIVHLDAFNSAEDFAKAQTGDSYLSPEEL